MDNNEIFQQAAQERWKEIGEKHGYSGVVHGAAEVLRHHGFETTGEELSTIFHDPLSEYHSAMESRAVPFTEVAKAMSYGGHGETRGQLLPHPFNKIYDSNQFPYPLDRTPELKIDVQWIEKEFEAHLKKEKIRKNTKRWQKTITENAGKIIAAAVEDAKKAKEKAIGQYEKNIKELDQLHDKAIASVEGHSRRNAIRTAFVEAAGIEPRPDVEEAGTKRVEAWANVVKKIEEHAAYLENAVRETNPEEAAIDALAWNKTLRPFLDAAGVNYKLPSWAS